MTLLGCELKLKGEKEKLYSNETRRCVTHALAAASAGGACWLGTRTRTLTEEIASERVYRRECGSNRSLICIGHKLNLLTLLPPLLTHRSFKRL